MQESKEPLVAAFFKEPEEGDQFVVLYSVSQKNTPSELAAIFPKRLGIFQPNFTRLLCVPIYSRL